MGFLPLKQRVNPDKKGFATKQRMFGLLIIDEGPSLSMTDGRAVAHFKLVCWCQFQVYLSATSFYALLDNCQQCRLCTLSMSSSALWCPGLNEEEVVERNRIPKICQRFLIFEKIQFRVIRTDTNVWGNC